MRALFLGTIVTFLALPIVSASCGTTPSAKRAESAAPAIGGSATAAAARTRPGTRPAISSLRRSQVQNSIAKGLGSFLQGVSVEDWPVMHGGTFYGFKIKAIREDWGVDLRPGDVVLRVNGLPIEHPEEADLALRSLENANALKVDFERDGKLRTLELPIVDD